jgi:hypothetical protein
MYVSAVRPAAFRSCHQAELFGRIVRVHRRGPRLGPSLTLKAGQDMSSHTRATGSLRWVGVSHRTLMAWRLLSAIMLLVMGGIHGFVRPGSPHRLIGSG